MLAPRRRSGADGAPCVAERGPGQRTVELRFQGQRIIFVRDLVELPAQLRDGTVHLMTDHDRHQAAGARVALFARMKAEGTVIAPVRLTVPTFGTITDDDRWADATAR